MREIDKKLFRVVEKGDITEFRAFVSKKEADVNAVNDQGEKLIHVAAKSGSKAIIDELIKKHGVGVNDLDAQGCTPLYHAVKCGRTRTVEHLMYKCYADVNKANKDGAAPVHAAASLGDSKIRILKLLVEKVNVNCTSGGGWTPLHYAAGGRNCLETMKFLVKEGAITDIKNASGRAPIHIAAINGCDGNIEFLLANGVDVNDVDGEGHTALYHAAYNGWGGTMNFLLGRGGLGIDANEKRRTLLYHALEQSYLKVVEFFVGGGRVGVDYADEKGKTLLCYLVEMGNLQVANLIVDVGKGINVSDDELLFLDEEVKVAKYLLDQGADIYALSANGQRPLSIAEKTLSDHSKSMINYSPTKTSVSSPPCDTGDSQTLSRFSTEEGSSAVGGYLFRNRTSVLTYTSLCGAIRGNNLSEVIRLMDEGADISEINDDNELLHFVAEAFSDRMVKYIMNKDKGKVLDLEFCNKEGNTPLCVAIKDGRTNVPKIFIEWGANVNHCNKEGNTPLHLAAKRGLLNVVKALLKEGASYNVKNKAGQKPLDLVEPGPHAEGIRDLLLASARSSTQAKDGQTLLRSSAGEGGTIKVAGLTAVLDNLCISGANGTSSNITGEDGYVGSVSTLGDSGTQNSIDTALYNAVKDGKLAKVNDLIGKCSNINKVYENGNTLLHFATGNRKSSIAVLLNGIVKVLIDKGAEIESCNDEGNRPLHLAAEGGLLNVVKTLLKEGALCNVKNKAGKRPVDLVKTGSRDQKIRDLLSEHDKQQSKANDVEGKQARLKSDGRVNNTPASAGSSTQASASDLTNISEGDKIISSSSKPSSAFGGARPKHNLCNSQQNVPKVKGLGKDKSMPESSHSSSDRSFRSRVGRTGSDPVGPPSTFLEQEKRKGNIQKLKGSLQPPTHAAPRSRGAESDPNRGDERRWGERVKPKGEESKATPSVRRGK